MCNFDRGRGRGWMRMIYGTAVLLVISLGCQQGDDGAVENEEEPSPTMSSPVSTSGGPLSSINTAGRGNDLLKNITTKLRDDVVAAGMNVTLADTWRDSIRAGITQPSADVAVLMPKVVKLALQNFSASAFTSDDLSTFSHVATLSSMSQLNEYAAALGSEGFKALLTNMASAAIEGVAASNSSDKGRIIHSVGIGLMASLEKINAIREIKFEYLPLIVRGGIKSLVAAFPAELWASLTENFSAGLFKDLDVYGYPRSDKPSGIADSASTLLTTLFESALGASDVGNAASGLGRGLAYSLANGEMTTNEMSQIVRACFRKIANTIGASSLSGDDQLAFIAKIHGGFTRGIIEHEKINDELLAAFATQIGLGLGTGLADFSLRDTVVRGGLDGIIDPVISSLKSTHLVPYIGINYVSGVLQGFKDAKVEVGTSLQSTLTEALRSKFAATQWPMFRITAATWAVNKHLATPLTYKDPFQAFYDDNSFSSSKIMVYDNSTLQVKHLGFEIGALISPSEIGGDVDCSAGNKCFGVPGSGDLFGYFDGASGIDERVISSGMGYTFNAKAGTILKSPIDGVVIAINKAVNGYATDWSLSIKPTKTSRYVFLYDHIDSVSVAVGDTVTAGQVVGSKAAAGRVEFNYQRIYVNYLDKMQEGHDLCFTNYLHPDHASSIKSNLDAFFTSVRNNAITKNYTTLLDQVHNITFANLYNQNLMPIVGCYALTMVDAVARVGYPNNLGVPPYNYAWPVKLGVGDTETKFWFYPNEK